MKHFLLRFFIMILLLGASIFGFAQGFELYGITSQGPDGGGTVFNINPDGTGYNNKFNFSDPGSLPFGELEKGSDGKFYGLTTGGGNNDYGALFSYDPVSGNYSKLYSFDNVNGASPNGSLILGADGKFYGMTSSGSLGFGVIFSYDPVSGTYSKLYSFDYANGAYPHGSLTVGADGIFYGLTANGGTGGFGVIFSFDPVTSSYTNLYSFDNTDGANPFEDLTLGLDGKLYGLTTSSVSGSGVIFSFDPIASSYVNLHGFDGTNGASPYGSLALGSDGIFYGTTTGGGSGSGVIFSYDPALASFNNVHNFDFANGATPFGSLVQGSDGKFYGMTNAGGSGVGVIFSFDPVTSNYDNLRSFDYANGASPYGRLTKDPDGNLYGMTHGGGSSYGVIFSYNPVSTAYNKLYSFDKPNGAFPRGSLTQGSNGKFYGLAVNGGATGNGVMFSYDPGSASYSNLHDFDYATGINPYGGLTLGLDGKLYGTTYNGGGSGAGVIFSYDPVGSTYANLYSFDFTNGANSYGNLTIGTDGKFYGMTVNGGSGNGVIFSYDPATSSFSNLHNFDGANGGNPYGSLTQGADGNFYGLTSAGGTGNGVIFSYDPVGATYSKLYSFDGADGGTPFGSMTLGSADKLFGLTGFGGGSGKGVIFSYDPSADSYSNLHDFDIANGANPFGSLIAASDGKLYGMTHEGGSSGSGVVFSYSPASTSFTKIYDFDINSGRFPFNGQLLVHINPPTTPASGITFSNVLSTQMRISFTPGNGAKRIVVLREASAVNWTPVDGQFYTPNTDFSLAADQGSGNKVVMADTFSQVDITGLTSGINYFVKVFEYNATATDTKYLTTGAPSANKMTLALPNVYVFAPADNAVNQNVTLTITAVTVAGAVTYTIELNTAPDFSDVSKILSGGKKLTFSGLSYDTKYYARVKTNMSPDYGKVTNFTTAPPEFFAYVFSPVNGATGVSLSYLVTANTVIGAATYQIELSTDQFDFSSALVKTGIRKQSFTGLLSYNTTYYSRVKTDLSPNYGVTRSFTTAPPLTYVTVPADNAVNQLWHLDVSANAVTGATGYIIQLSQDPGFGAGTIIENSGVSRTMSFAGLTYGAKYYTRATTNFAPTVFGPVRSFTVANLSFFTTLFSPVNNATNVNLMVNLIANNVVDAASYTIEANTDPDFGVGTEIIKTSPSRLISFTLSQATTYYVRVRTDLSPPDEWGATSSFTTGDQLSLAYVTIPKNAGIGVPTTVLIYANPLPGGTSYTIQLNTAPDFSGDSITMTNTKRYMTFSGLAPGAIYYTRVKTNLAGGAWGTTYTHFTTADPGARGRVDWRGTASDEDVALQPFNVKIFGNPFHEKLKFLIETPDQQEASVMLFDVTGRTMHASTERTNTFVEIDKAMTQGMYLLRVQTVDGAKVLRVVKMD